MGLPSERNIFFGNEPMGKCVNKIFFVLNNKIKNPFIVGIKICKNDLAQNLISNRLVIFLRSLLFKITRYMQTMTYFGTFQKSFEKKTT
jgi:hypothetical protein